MLGSTAFEIVTYPPSIWFLLWVANPSYHLTSVVEASTASGPYAVVGQLHVDCCHWKSGTTHQKLLLSLKSLEEESSVEPTANVHYSGAEFL